MYQSGVSGPLFDWLRMLYDRMRYVVRHTGHLSEAFQSLIGLLTGDTASPILWNIYFADIDIPEHEDDTVFEGRRISHVEQADDVAIWCTSAAGLQVKLDHFFRWCSRNSMTISTSKTFWMLFGRFPAHFPTFYIGNVSIDYETRFKFVGVHFESISTGESRPVAFRYHYKAKALKARNVMNATFASMSVVGTLPPREGRILYYARVDPHLTFGAEVALDTVASDLECLSNIQHSFLRRLLGVGTRSVLAFLFTEMGLLPIRYRRIILATRYLQHLLRLPHTHYAYSALMDSIRLAASDQRSWFGDLRQLLLSLPGQGVNLPSPVEMLRDPMSLEGVDKKITEVANLEIWSFIETSTKASLLRSRFVPSASRRVNPIPTGVQNYLIEIAIPKHRRAYLKLLLSDHKLAIERLRYNERYQPRVPRELRLCRFCRQEVEDEAHALFGCTSSPDILELRTKCIQSLTQVDDGVMTLWLNRRSPVEFLRAVIHRVDLCKTLAWYTFSVFEVYSTMDIWRQ